MIKSTRMMVPTEVSTITRVSVSSSFAAVDFSRPSVVESPSAFRLVVDGVGLVPLI